MKKINLYQLILENEQLMSPIEPEVDFFDDLLKVSKKSQIEDGLRTRIFRIEKMLSESVKNIKILTGEDAAVIMHDYHNILNQLKEARDIIACGLNDGRDTLKEILVRDVFHDRTPYELRPCLVCDKPGAYLDAADLVALTMGTRHVPVILDGGLTTYTVNGELREITADIVDNTVQIDQCRALATRLAADGCHPNYLTYSLSVSTKPPVEWKPTSPFDEWTESRPVLVKQALYSVELDKLLISNDGELIYEGWHETIPKGREHVLADKFRNNEED